MLADGVLMLPLLERTETSVRRRFVGSYHASESRAFFAAADMLSNVTNVNHGGYAIFWITLLRGPPEKSNVSVAGMHALFPRWSKRELPSSGLMSASGRLRMPSHRLLCLWLLSHHLSKAAFSCMHAYVQAPT